MSLVVFFVLCVYSNYVSSGIWGAAIPAAFTILFFSLVGLIVTVVLTLAIWSGYFPDLRRTLIQISLAPTAVFLTLGFVFCGLFGSGFGIVSSAAYLASECHDSTISESSVTCSSDWYRTFSDVDEYISDVYRLDRDPSGTHSEAGGRYLNARTRDPMIAILVTFILWIIADIGSLYYLFFRDDKYPGSQPGEGGAQQGVDGVQQPPSYAPSVEIQGIPPPYVASEQPPPYVVAAAPPPYPADQQPPPYVPDQQSPPYQYGYPPDQGSP